MDIKLIEKDGVIEVRELHFKPYLHITDRYSDSDEYLCIDHADETDRLAALVAAQEACHE